MSQLGAMCPSSVDATTSRECAACRLLHEPGQGWDFCERDLDVTGLFSEENDRGRVDRLISMPSREDREMNFFRLYVDKEHRWSRGDDAWVEEARQEPPIASVATPRRSACRRCLPRCWVREPTPMPRSSPTGHDSMRYGLLRILRCTA